MNSNFENFVSALYTKSVRMPLKLQIRFTDLDLGVNDALEFTNVLHV